MRHTFGTYLYDLTKDIDTVGRKLGHKGLKNVDKYIHVAKDLREQSGRRNLFNQALRSIKARGKADKRDCLRKIKQSFFKHRFFLTKLFFFSLIYFV